MSLIELCKVSGIYSIHKKTKEIKLPEEKLFNLLLVDFQADCKTPAGSEKLKIEPLPTSLVTQIEPL